MPPKSRADILEKRDAARAKADEAFSAANPARRRRTPEEKKKGLNWKAFGLLLLFVIPAAIPVFAYLGEKLANYYGTSFELTPEQRLTNYYHIHNPANVPNVKRILRKFRGQEDVLFATLENKYGDPV